LVSHLLFLSAGNERTISLVREDSKRLSLSRAIEHNRAGPCENEHDTKPVPNL
jgi:hypothetical protein